MGFSWASVSTFIILPPRFHSVLILFNALTILCSILAFGEVEEDAQESFKLGVKKT